uniref:Phosphotriesterase-related protein n=1 Tax=Trichogramma kaykai TaxID=54128 RepID=A0ABD2XIC5_9HYME
MRHFAAQNYELRKILLGPVAASKLGRTLTHEHLALNFEKFYLPPPPRLEKFLNGSIGLDNVGVLRQHPHGNRYNLRFDDAESAAAVLEDVQFYGASGGGTICENSSQGLNRRLGLMQRCSRASGVHVVAGTGFYVALTAPGDSARTTSEESMYDLMLDELTIGCRDLDPSVLPCKAGFIGEVGSAWPIEDYERRAIRATARLQAELGCPVSFHPGRDKRAPFEIMRVYLEAGGRADKAVMSHLDRTLTRCEDLLEFAELGCYCQQDLFGLEVSYYQLHPETDMPSDAQRIDRVKLLAAEGRLDRVLISHDIHTKHRTMRYGGHGYSHIINNVIPQMLIKGMSQEQIDRVTIDNPRDWLVY